MMYYFCTYFDRHYLHRGLALIRSLKKWCAEFRLWVLCMDPVCHGTLSVLNLENLHLIALEDLEAEDRDLSRAKTNRTRMEYYFTCTPSLILYVLNRWHEVDILTYLDGDLFFFSDPSPIYRELGEKSVGIIPHRFPRKLDFMEMHGKYNVGYLSFRGDQNAMACLRWWRNRCIDWCHDRVEEGRFADQKYLDAWPVLFNQVAVIQHKGANLAPWNVENFCLTDEDQGVRVDGEPLIFFHFHGFRQLNRWLYDPNLTVYKARLSEVMTRALFAPYISALSEVAGKTCAAPATRRALLEAGVRNRPEDRTLLEQMKGAFNRVIYYCRLLIAMNFILVAKGRVIQGKKGRPSP